ncbi:methionine adenosyltransferase [Clostridia bacterium]|nr:methionine adenosyltransferase [Clostridia bacterium]
MSKMLFTSESVTEGHPDKICDQISDSILDAILEKDPKARVACETMVTTGLVLVGGEVTTNCYVDIAKIARKTVAEIGYTRAKFGFDASTCSVLVSLDEQSSDIAMGVDQAMEKKVSCGNAEEWDQIGAGDQGMMFGYATDETDEYMPLTISLAHKLTKKLTEVRKQKKLTYLRPDGKSQVTVEYEDHIPKRIEAVVISTQHDAKTSLEKIRKDIIENVINPVIPAEYMDENTKIYVNPTGRFVIGGPQGDAGVTGRKIIVDTYGGMARHGGGAFSGKDPTKVDRSASYAARYVAKNLVGAGLAKRCEIQIAYAIGVARPVSVMVETFGTSTIPEEKLVELVKDTFELRPAGIIATLGLQKPIYKQTASYGHFGRNDLDLPWEKLDKVAELKQKVQEM